MPIPSFNSLRAKLHNACDAYLRPEIQYKPAGGAYGPVAARMDYSTEEVNFANAQTIEQGMMVSIHRTLLNAKPTDADRIKLPEIDGVWKPVGVGLNQPGTHWLFRLVKVNG
ncbi:hypothetical protein GRI39_01980 [Altererythrobacter indicus]|uniref:Uncharacterized protein n=1 Tax=Altericroceibacterium indicum TaxID=374177 RepID=A0A845A7L9_9SPHN|nr:hypothetical protein [Altericroceibacterium indicum]MXP24815.1 hypothetical protein [Altericroceibacterium indicum]